MPFVSFFLRFFFETTFMCAHARKSKSEQEMRQKIYCKKKIARIIIKVVKWMERERESAKKRNSVKIKAHTLKHVKSINSVCVCVCLNFRQRKFTTLSSSSYYVSINLYTKHYIHVQFKSVSLCNFLAGRLSHSFYTEYFVANVESIVDTATV